MRVFVMRYKLFKFSEGMKSDIVRLNDLVPVEMV